VIVRLDLLDFFEDPLEAVNLEHGVPVLGDAVLKRGNTESVVDVKALDGCIDVLLRKREVVMQRQRQLVGR
jgi:hypothetical protein